MKVDLRLIPPNGASWIIKGTIELPEEIVELLKRLVYPPMLFEEGAPIKFTQHFYTGDPID